MGRPVPGPVRPRGDRLREETLARQKDLGVVPADAELTARPGEIPAWDDMPDVLKPILARQMEVYAGFLEHVDHHVGRVIDAVTDLGILDDTLVFYIIGDNGASAEGQLNGTFNELLTFNGMADPETPEFLASKIDALGGPEAYNHYARHLPQRLDGLHQTPHTLAHRRNAALRRGHLGTVRARRLHPGARPGRIRPRSARQAATALADRSHPAPGPAPRRPFGRKVPRLPGRPAGTGHRHLPDPVRRDAPAIGRIGHQHQEPVPLGHRRSRSR
jgi:arylsulfatase A-like enzyme